MSTIKADSFWDGKDSGGVRCSVPPEDSDKYLDPSAQCFEHDGRSISTHMPRGLGLRGVVIPRATPFGGSRGFDPHKPRLINIDPDIKGQACVVDLQEITKEKMSQAYKLAAQNPMTMNSQQLLAAQTFHNLAVSFEPIGMGREDKSQMSDRIAPVGMSGAYVAPKAAPGGGQIANQPAGIPINRGNMISPSVSPRHVKAAPVVTQPIEPMQKAAELVSDIHEEETAPVTVAAPVFKDQSTRRPVFKEKPIANHSSVAAPGTTVTFEMEGWGKLDAAYHEVIKNDGLLVLVYDNRYKNGMRYWPPTTDRLIAVRIANQGEVYFVNSYGNRFTHSDYEYCILVIDQESGMHE